MKLASQSSSTTYLYLLKEEREGVGDEAVSRVVAVKEQTSDRSFQARVVSFELEHSNKKGWAAMQRKSK